jgi:hypothetical protein
MERLFNSPPEASVEMDRTFWASVIGTAAFAAVVIAYAL